MPIFGSPGTYSGSYPTAENISSPSTYVLNNPYTSGLGQATTYFPNGLTSANSGVGVGKLTPWDRRATQIADSVLSLSNSGYSGRGNWITDASYSGDTGGSSGGGGASGSYDWGSGGDSSNFGYPAYGVRQGWGLGLGPQYSTSGLGTADWPLSGLGAYLNDPNFSQQSNTYGAYNPSSATYLRDYGQFNPGGTGPGYAAYGVSGGWPNQTNQSVAQSLGYGAYGQESSYGTNPNMWKGSYIGPMQISRATAQQYNADKLFPGWDTNAQANRQLGNYILQQQLGQYGGDTGRTLTAYNSGPGNVSPQGSGTPYKTNYTNAGNPNARVSNYIGNVTDTASGLSQQNAFGNYTGQAMTASSPQVVSAMSAMARVLGVSGQTMGQAFGGHGGK